MSTPLALALFSAFVQGFSFAFSRQLTTYSKNGVRLAFYSLLAFSFPGLVLLPTLDLSRFGIAPELPLLMALSIAVGQVALLQAMRRAHASFVVPMMGIKIFWVAGLSALLLGQVYGPLIYLAGLGVVVSLFFLNDGTLRSSAGGLVLVSLTTLGFAANDVLIVLMLERGYTIVEAFVYSLTLPLILLAPLGFALPRDEQRPGWSFVGALAVYALLQGTAIVCLVIAMNIAREATVINIVQSARGLFSILAVYVFARMGLTGFERISARQYRRRVVGALIMTASLVLAVLASR